MEAPLRIYLFNPQHFEIISQNVLHDYLRYWSLAAGVSLLLVWFLSTRNRLHRGDGLLAAFSGVLWLLWIQRHVFQWKFGVLDGGPIAWSNYWYFGVIDGLFWLVLFTVVLVKRAWFSTNAFRINSLFIALSLSIFLPDYRAYLKIPVSNDHLSLSYSTMFSFSSKSNVILIVLDAAQSNVGLELIESSPDLKEHFRDFTFFANSTSGAMFTRASIAIILTGSSFDNRGSFNDFYRPLYREDSVFSYFKDRHYRIENYDSIFFDYHGILDLLDNTRGGDSLNGVPELIDATLLNSLPYFLKSYVYDDGDWLLTDSRLAKNVIAGLTSLRGQSEHVALYPARSKFNDDVDTAWIEALEEKASIEFDQPVFKYLHFWGPHSPHHLDANGRPTRSGSPYESYKSTFHFKLKLMARFMRKLKEIGVYEDATIVIAGDHGCACAAELHIFRSPFDGRRLTHDTATARGNALFMLKRPGVQGEFKITHQPLHLGSTKQILASISENEPAGDALKGGNRVRKYFKYWHKIGENSSLAQYFEYLVVGHAWLPDSWIPYHTHARREDFENCAFNASDSPILLTRASFQGNTSSRSLLNHPVDGRTDRLLVLLRSASGSAFSMESATDVEITLNGKPVKIEPYLASKGLLQIAIRTRKAQGNLEIVVRGLPVQELLLLQIPD